MSNNRVFNFEPAPEMRADMPSRDQVAWRLQTPALDAMFDATADMGERRSHVLVESCVVLLVSIGWAAGTPLRPLLDEIERHMGLMKFAGGGTGMGLMRVAGDGTESRSNFIFEDTIDMKVVGPVAKAAVESIEANATGLYGEHLACGKLDATIGMCAACCTYYRVPFKAFARVTKEMWSHVHRTQSLES